MNTIMNFESIEDMKRYLNVNESANSFTIIGNENLLKPIFSDIKWSDLDKLNISKFKSGFIEDFNNMGPCGIISINEDRIDAINILRLIIHEPKSQVSYIIN